MAALTEDRNTVNRNAEAKIPVPVAASTTVYGGSGVCKNATGYAAPAADTVNFVFMGVAVERGNNSSGADGAIEVEVYQRGTFEFTTAGLTQANLGDLVYWVDDQTVALAATTTNDIPAGKIVRVISATSVEVLIDSAAAGGI